MDEPKLKQEIYLREDQLSKYWGISRNTLQKWRSACVGPIYIKRVGRVVYKLSDVLKYERENSFQGTSERAYPTTDGEDGKK
jgi:hypothetical protein